MAQNYTSVTTRSLDGTVFLSSVADICSSHHLSPSILPLFSHVGLRSHVFLLPFISLLPFLPVYLRSASPEFGAPSASERLILSELLEDSLSLSEHAPTQN